MASTAHLRLSSTPAAAGAANTRTFLAHCFGRASLTRPAGSESRFTVGPSGVGTGASGAAAGVDADVVLMTARSSPGVSHPGRQLAPQRAGQVAEGGHDVAERARD